MHNGRARLEAVEKKVGGKLRTSRKGQPYLVVALVANVQLRVMYFERTRQFKIYRDSGRTGSEPIAKCLTSSETAGVIQAAKAQTQPAPVSIGLTSFVGTIDVFGCIGQ